MLCSETRRGFAASLLLNCSISLKLHTDFVVYFEIGFASLLVVVAAVIVGVIAALLINRWKDNKQR